MSPRTVEQRTRPFSKLLLLAGALVVITSLAFVACKSSKKKEPEGTTPTAAAQTTQTVEASACPPAGSAPSLTGSGATFPAPLYTKWADEFDSQCSVEINYQAVGSGGGITAISDQTVDFGASDAIMTAAQEAAAKGGAILHIPMTLGGIAVVTNLSGIQAGQLKLTPDVLAKIYLGQITKWSDPAIAANNSGLSLPDTDIAVVHRSDGSGTTFQFTDYLSKVSTEWQSQVGSATTVDWPAGIGGEKNAGVAAQVKQVPGAIGYVEVTYAVQNNMSSAAVQNSSGNFVEPTLEAISAAAAGVSLPDDMKVLIDNSTNPAAYPIAGFSWILAYVNQTDQAKGQTLAYYLWWSIHDGQRFSEALTYAVLPDDAVAKAEALIKQLMYNNQPILP